MEEKRNPIAIIVTRFGEIKIKLYPKEAPNTVNCFISYQKKRITNEKFEKKERGIWKKKEILLQLL